MAKTSKLVSTGADRAIAGSNMTVKPMAVYNSEHEIVGYLPMIYCVNQYGYNTMLMPGLYELSEYYKGVSKDEMDKWGLNTPEGAMEVWRTRKAVDSQYVPWVGDDQITNAIIAGGQLRSLEHSITTTAEAPADDVASDVYAYEPDYEGVMEEAALAGLSDMTAIEYE